MSVKSRGVVNPWQGDPTSYDAFMYFTPYRQMLRDVALAAGVRPGEMVLDAGCGTGNVTTVLCERGARLLGVDISGQALAVARRKAGDKAGWVIADMEAPLPFPDESFDAAVSIHSLYLLSLPLPALLEIRRVLRTGGRLVVVHPLPTNFLPAIVDHIRRSHPRDLVASVARLPSFLRIMRSAALTERIARQRFWSADELVNRVSDAGFAVESTSTTYGGISTLLRGFK